MIASMGLLLQLTMQAVLAAVRCVTMTRADLAIENLALRQQVAMYQRQRHKPQPTHVDRALWVVRRSLKSSTSSLVSADEHGLWWSRLRTIFWSAKSATS